MGGEGLGGFVVGRCGRGCVGKVGVTGEGDYVGDRGGG